MRSRWSALSGFFSVGLVGPLLFATGCQPRRPALVSGEIPSPVVRLDAHLSARVDFAVRAVLAAGDVPGASVAVLRHDTVVVLRGYGVADRERGTPVTPETVFQIASSTKPFTAAAVLLLSEDRKLDLDAPASRYLDWLPERYRAVTLRQLLTHTGGITPDVRRANIDEMTEADFRVRFTEGKATFPPGTGWQYANAGYTLLAQVVETVSGEPFGEFLRRRIFVPLGMTHTAYRAPESRDVAHAVGYDLVDARLERMPHIFAGWGNSGIETTATDMARWATALERRALLRSESYKVMWSPARLVGDTAVNFAFRNGRASYGLGWFLMSDQGTLLVTHGGVIAGFSSVLHRFPERGWSVVVLSNRKQTVDRQNEAEVIARTIVDASGLLGAGTP